MTDTDPREPQLPAPAPYTPPVADAQPAYTPPVADAQPAYTPPVADAQPAYAPPAAPAPYQSRQYGQPGGVPPYAGQPGSPYQPPYIPLASQRTNTLAIISLVTAFFLSPAAVITGHMALSQIKRTGEGGNGLAVAGLILGYVGVFFGLIWFAFIIVATVAGIAESSSSYSY
ncbi:DUF4190 domain-containing protein [Glaciihabitans sp. dw_435]|uniref:DUF4190 domain-containing protein n=1 Tax=Glaciihabitans sp. dw_435 TaxID=2720081 RepID=UPI001BD4B6C3|nr:DUF4190 domain-containing protein [Glaciihabitans sp. dw_435]